MAQHGANTVILLEQYDLTAYGTSVSVEASVDNHDSTVFGNTAHRNQVGLRMGGLGLNFFYDDGVAGAITVLKSIFQASAAKIATVFTKLTTIGNPAIICYADVTRLDDSIQKDDLISVATYLQAAEDGLDFGVSLHALAAETTSTNSASVDNAASSANGGVGTLQVTDISGSPSVAIKVQHSADNSTWADLVTFTAVTAAGAQRSEVAAATTVNRYLRAISTFTGGSTPSITYNVAFARR